MPPSCSQVSPGRPGLALDLSGKADGHSWPQVAAGALKTEQELSLVGTSQRALSFEGPGKGSSREGWGAPHHAVPH